MKQVVEAMSFDTVANKRRAYQPPRLSVLGDVGSLTEAGSQVGMEYMAFIGCTNDPASMNNTMC